MPSLAEIAEAAARSEINLTLQAQFLIKVVLDSITEDPHPSWRTRDRERLTRGALEDQQQRLVRELPAILSAIGRETAILDRTLSTFDILHWLTKRLDDLCPFDK
jgi:hypothetical protein